MKNRSHYTSAFKLDAVSLVLDQGYSTTQASESLGIRPNTLKENG